MSQLTTVMIAPKELSMPPPTAKAGAEPLLPEPAMAWLLATVQLARTAVPAYPFPRLMPQFAMPPASATPPEPAVVVPPSAWLPVMVQLLAMSVPSRLTMPPPWPLPVGGLARLAVPLLPPMAWLFWILQLV